MMLKCNGCDGPRDRKRSLCTECEKLRKKKYYRTKKGLISRIYSHQKLNSKDRGHPLPSYSKKELKDWLLVQEDFHHLFHLWKVSNYDSSLVPSVDRLDDYIPYNFSNIRITTWNKNRSKGHRDRRSGINNKASKAVMQFTKDNEFICEHYSAYSCERETGIQHQLIQRCCVGGTKTAKGFKWKYKEDM